MQTLSEDSQSELGLSGIPDVLKNLTIVIKYGGSALNDIAENQQLFQQIAQLASSGVKIILVHGGGPQISRMLSRLQIESRHVDGLRITDQETLDVAEMVLCGPISKSIVTNLQRHNVNALGLSGKDLNLFTVKAITSSPVNLGYFGEVDRINTSQMRFLLSLPLISVITPIGMDANGDTFMLDADALAAGIAAAIQADKLFILTNVPGVLQNAESGKTVINSLSATEAEELLTQNQVSGGMIPKLQSCIEAVRSGVKGVHIFDGQTPDALLKNTFSEEVIGTVLY
jgi:acetylglutamate kinase